MTSARTTGTLPEQVEVFIVGAGFAGLGAAIKLAESGEQDFLCIDRGAEVGGTWRDNSYPGATCNVPSQLYSFSFALNPDWSRSFSPQPEIQQYLRRVAAESGVLDRFRFGVTFESASWDAASARWRIETSAGPTIARLLVSAAGSLSEPNLPAIDGIERFAGELFHSACWDHQAELAGRRVAVIGTGASAIQIVPAIADQVDRLDVYQRTPPWVLPRRERAYHRWERWALRRLPLLQRLARSLVYLAREATVGMFIAYPRIGRLVSRGAIANIRRSITDPGLRAKLLPDYALGCKRVLLSNDWYPTLARPNVELITEPIARITEHGIVTADGRERPADVLVVATGFRPTEPPIADRIRNGAGRTLAEAWTVNGLQAYKGSTVSGFPNLFLLIGPNTALGHSSMVFIAESQISYLIDAHRTMKRQRLATVEPLPEIQRAWNADLQRRMTRTVWNTGCRSWYLDRHGRNVTLWPRTSYAFRRLTARFDLAAYRSTPLPAVPG
ncbi:MAG TPA: NAD(P)/FAD-dependent oxidoreductase [Jatrophihabitans sp.]|nr:NAD(P)/FAD-dependent oxidoreductase [Jatrophihabitans sp.]